MERVALVRRGHQEAQGLPCTRPVDTPTGRVQGGGGGGEPRLGGVAASRFSQELLGSTSQDPSSAELNQELWTLRRVTGRPPPLWCGQASWEEATQGASGKKTTQKTPAQSTGSSPLPQKPFPKQNRIHTKEEILQLNFKRKREGGVATGGPRQGLGTESVDSTLVAPQGRPAMVS